MEEPSTPNKINYVEIINNSREHDLCSHQIRILNRITKANCTNKLRGPRRERNLLNCINISPHLLPIIKRSSLKKIKLAHLNVRSLRNRTNYLEVEHFIQQNDIDIFTISETWLNSSVTNAEINISGYKLYRLDRRHKKGGGVCAYIRRNLKTKVLNSISKISERGFHQLWLEIQHVKLKSIIVCVAYRPPDIQLDCFVNDLAPSLTDAFSLGKEVFIAGDLNCDMFSNGPQSTCLKEFCASFNLTQLISQPTRVTPNSSTLLDVILTTSQDLVTQSEVICTSISDHFPVIVTLNLKRPRPQAIKFKTRSYKSYNPVDFDRDVSMISWNILNNVENVNDKVDVFNSLFGYIVERHAPIREMRFKHKGNPWITPTIKDAMKTRDQLLKKAWTTKHNTDWIAVKAKRKEVKNNLKAAESVFIQGRIKECKGKSGDLWKVIRNIIPTASASSNILYFTKEHKLVADEFNQYFTSVGQRMINSVTKLVTDFNILKQSSTVSPEVFGLEPFYFQPVTIETVKACISKMPGNKSPGADKIPLRIYKDCLANILFPLTNIINRSFETCIFPNNWKIAEVVPHPKEGDYELATNNRPISLIQSTAKVCERIALEQFMSYLMDNDILTRHQSGNRNNHSTETLNILVSDFILNAMDSKQITVLVLLDLSKAFDSINRDILLEKLEKIGASPSAVRWFKSYLTGRQQFVRIGTTISDSLGINHGVPQGSILGPLLFDLYINDLPRIPAHCNTECYVDDSKLFLAFTLDELDDAVAKVNNDLQSVFEWCCSNYLMINPEKTKVMFFGVPQLLTRLPRDVTLTLMGKELQPIANATDLGMTWDTKMAYDNHVTNTVSSCMNILFQISRIRHLFNRKTLIGIINSLVFSKLYYCSSVWASTSINNIKKMQCVQNFAARIVTGTHKYDHITPCLKELKWIPVEKELYLRDAVMAFKCINGSAPAYLSENFSRRGFRSGRITRQSNDIHVPKCRTSMGQKSFVYRASVIWNSLSNDLKLCTSAKNFKCCLKKQLLESFLEVN